LSRNVTSARPLLAGQAALVRLAIESWVDGCLGEGAAAACAAQEATSTTRPDIRSTQQRIAQDEARHAELAWDVLQWSLQAGGRDVREALHATAAAKPADPATDHAGDSFEEYGIASNAQHEAIAEAQRQRAVQRLDAMLAS